MKNLFINIFWLIFSVFFIGLIVYGISKEKPTLPQGYVLESISDIYRFRTGGYTSSTFVSKNGCINSAIRYKSSSGSVDNASQWKKIKD